MRAAPLSARLLARAGLVAGLFAALAGASGVTRAQAQTAPAPVEKTLDLALLPAQAAPVVAPALAPAQATTAADAFDMPELDGRSLPLGGALARDQAVWEGWKRRFLTDQGRVVDTANGLMSHSEGQGYGMVLAVAAGDRVAFERIWAWTRANLMVRPDELMAWRWEPDKRAGVGDVNNASDGDILVAWALTEAAEFWAEPSYRVAARRIAVEVSRKTFLLKTRHGTLILPAVYGFTDQERGDGPVVNLAYWVFPALERLRIVAPEVDWKGVTQSGLDLLKAAQFGPAGLPPDWLALKGDKPALAQGFAPAFGYDAIRAPLYMAMAGIGERAHYAPFVALWRSSDAARKIPLSGAPRAVAGPSAAKADGKLEGKTESKTDARTVPVKVGAEAPAATSTPAGEPMGEPGYRAPGALLMCAVSGRAFPADLRRFEPSENYYPATLRLLALAGARMRYPKCLQN